MASNKDSNTGAGSQYGSQYDQGGQSEQSKADKAAADAARAKSGQTPEQTPGPEQKDGSTSDTSGSGTNRR